VPEVVVGAYGYLASIELVEAGIGQPPQEVEAVHLAEAGVSGRLNQLPEHATLPLQVVATQNTPLDE
jgi:hypothetical protein